MTIGGGRLDLTKKKKNPYLKMNERRFEDVLDCGNVSRRRLRTSECRVGRILLTHRRRQRGSRPNARLFEDS